MTCAPHILLEGFVPLPLVGRGQGWGDAALPQAREKTGNPEQFPPSPTLPHEGGGRGNGKRHDLRSHDT